VSRGQHRLAESAITIGCSANDERANECPDKYGQQWLSKRVASHHAKHSTDYSRDWECYSIFVHRIVADLSYAQRIRAYLYGL
jgi:hypothetical protein